LNINYMTINLYKIKTCHVKLDAEFKLMIKKLYIYTVKCFKFFIRKFFFAFYQK